MPDVPASQGVGADRAGGDRGHRSGAGRGPVGGVDLGDSCGRCRGIGVGLIELGLQIAFTALQRLGGRLLLGSQLGDLVPLGLGRVPGSLGVRLGGVSLGLERADSRGGSILPGLTVGVLSTLDLGGGQYRLLDSRADLNR